MYIKNIKLTINKDKRLWVIMFIALIIATVLVFYSIFKILKGNINIQNKETIFSLNSYDAEYKAVIKSNKNQNTYKIKEEYLQEEKTGKEMFRFEIIDDNNLKFISLYDGESIKIVSDSQIGNFILENYEVNKENLLSIATFISLYNNVMNGLSEDFLVRIEEEDIRTIYKLIVKKTENQVNNTKLSFLKSVSILELIVNEESNLPMELVIYDNSNNMYIDVIYEKFDINPKFEEKLFAN